MKKLNNYELESFYGGGILATLFGIAAITAVVAGAYKVLTSDEGKIKIPGGTEISFEKPSKPTTSKVVSNPTRIKSNSSWITTRNCFKTIAKWRKILIFLKMKTF